MNLIKVTDPSILQQLGGNEPSYKKVTDPNIIKQLNAGGGEELPMRNFPFVNRPPTPRETEKTNRDVGQALQGASQSFINTPEQIANVFGKHLYKQFNYAPNTPAAHAGEIAGDAASYFLPGGTFKAGVNALKYVPKAAKAIETIEKGVKERPIVNFLLKGAKNAGEAALFEKAKNPKASLPDVGEAALLGGGIPATADTIFSSNPLVHTLARLAVGGGLGYYYGDLPGLAEGAIAGVTIPKAIKETGLFNAPISTEMLTREPNALAKARYQAGQRIGDVPTPAEAFGDRGSMARNQGRISHSEVGAQQMAEEGEKRIANQKKAITRLLDSIFPKNEKGKGIVKSLYNKAYSKNLTENAFSELMDDAVISQASNKVANDSAYMQDLKDVRKNNVAYLDQVKRALDDMEQTAIRAGEKNKARIYGNAGQKIVDAIEKEAPVYKKARMAAQRQIVRGQIENAMKKRAITGSNFFNKFLSNEETFNSLLRDLKNVPQAQRQLRDMKLAWENLVGMESTKTAVGRTAGSTNLAREEMTRLWNGFKDMFGAPRDVQRAKFIHDPNWWKEFDKVKAYKDKVKRREALANLVARGVAAGSLEAPLAKKADLMVEAPSSKK